MAISQRCFHCIARPSASRSASNTIAGLQAARRAAPLGAQRALSASASVRQAASGGAAAEADEGEKKIQQLLTEKFQPGTLEVADTSGGCGAFYSIVISSKAFKGVPTIKQHRMVNEELKNIISGIHGLQLKTIAED